MQPEVRLVDLDTEEVLGYLPLTAPSLNMDDEIVYQDDGVETTYKVEKLRYTAERTTIAVDHGQTRSSVYGRLDYIVSVVP